MNKKFYFCKHLKRDAKILLSNCYRQDNKIEIKKHGCQLNEYGFLNVNIFYKTVRSKFSKNLTTVMSRVSVQRVFRWV